MRRVATAVVSLVGLAAAVVVVAQAFEAALMMWAFRTDSPTAKRVLTSYHKHVTNPVMVRFFSGRSRHAAVVEHIGRTSGTTYETPVTAHRADDTVIVPLPYGTDVDWLRNLRAAGGGTMRLDNRSLIVREPEIVPMERVMPLLPPFVARIVTMHHTKQALVMRLDHDIRRTEG